ncbi:MAG: hypothetical protein V3V49_06650 [Candidatus Krumholzibacteria bacterium]
MAMRDPHNVPPNRTLPNHIFSRRANFLLAMMMLEEGLDAEWPKTDWGKE